MSETRRWQSGPLVDERALVSIGESVDGASACVERDVFGFADDGIHEVARVHAPC